MLDKKKLAQELGISIMTIDRHMKNGLPHYKIGKLVRFNLTEVLEYFAKKGE